MINFLLNLPENRLARKHFVSSGSVFYFFLIKKSRAALFILTSYQFSLHFLLFHLGYS